MLLMRSENKISLNGLFMAIFAFLTPFESFLSTSAGSLLKFYTIGIILFMALEVFFSDKIMRMTYLTPLIIFVAIMSISVLWSGHVLKGLDVLTAMALQVLLIVMITQVNFNSNDKRLILLAYIISAIMISVLVFINRNNINSTVNRSSVSTSSGVLDPNNIAAFIVCGLALLLNLPAKNVLFTVIKYSMIILMVVAVLLTVSRGGFIGMILVTFYYVISQKNIKRSFVFIIGVALVVLAVFYVSGIMGSNPINNLIYRFENDTNGSNRIDLWRIALKEIVKNPIFGFGLGESPYIIANHSMYNLGTHNTYLTIWLDGGLFSLLFFLIFIVFLAFKRDKNSRFSVSVYAMLLSGLSTSFFFDTYNKKILWLPILLCVMAISSPKNDKAEIIT